jgi:hypothetical protein
MKAPARYVLLTLLAADTVLACGPARSSGPDPRSSASSSLAPDGGLPTPAPSTKRGLIVPSDTGLGSQPTGSGPSTGTNGGRMDPGLASPTGTMN